MRIIGLTGNSGSGKSVVCGILASHGGYVIDADVVARKVVEQGEPAYAELAAYFGEGILLENKDLNRKLLADIVFADEEKNKKLIAITHKYIVAHIENEMAAVMANPGHFKFIVLDAPLLIEANLHLAASEVWVVHADENVKIKRMMDRDGLTLSQAQLRLSAQATFETLSQYATKIIYNDGDLTHLEKTVNDMLVEQE